MDEETTLRQKILIFHQLMESVRRSGGKYLPPDQNPYLRDRDFETIVARERQLAERERAQEEVR